MVEASRIPGLTGELRTLTPLRGQWEHRLLGVLIKDSLLSWLSTYTACASKALAQFLPSFFFILYIGFLSLLFHLHN